MIDEGCLKNVKEVWGLHNVPWDPIGQVFAKKGEMMCGAMTLNMKATGVGGHSSLKY